ncbi:hypothetical protein [Pseudomonas sp. G5(2012)]|uniref:hypothetical protein n=1 Tax=Pseudomonas sp. G5(2012) TaxID=1268068 RepID=UPI0005B3CEC4|nr:hypothetical protein [Pseudomonas sp. G5(2012)]
MKPQSFLQAAYIGYLLTISVSAAAMTDPLGNELDVEELYKQPICGYDRVIKKGLKLVLGEEPTGIKAENDKWELEIYTDPKHNTWTLVGKGKSPDSNPRKLCHLAKGITSDNPYQEAIWYKKYF